MSTIMKNKAVVEACITGFMNKADITSLEEVVGKDVQWLVSHPINDLKGKDFF